MVKQNQQLLLNIMYGPLLPRVIVYRIKNEIVTTHWSLSTINKIIILYILIVTQSCIHMGAIILIESSIQW